MLDVSLLSTFVSSSSAVRSRHTATSRITVQPQDYGHLIAETNKTELVRYSCEGRCQTVHVLVLISIVMCSLSNLSVITFLVFIWFWKSVFYKAIRTLRELKYSAWFREHLYPQCQNTIFQYLVEIVLDDYVEVKSFKYSEKEKKKLKALLQNTNCITWATIDWKQ